MVVGLPYPDIKDPVLQEKMASMDQMQSQSDLSTSSTATISGQSYYHNLCMRAVNQSIGRAIRHQGDYAAILLLDQRYETDGRVWSSLPHWLKKKKTTATINEATAGNDGTRPMSQPFAKRIQDIRAFFEEKAEH